MFERTRERERAQTETDNILLIYEKIIAVKEREKEPEVRVDNARRIAVQNWAKEFLNVSVSLGGDPLRWGGRARLSFPGEPSQTRLDPIHY